MQIETPSLNQAYRPELAITSNGVEEKLSARSLASQNKSNEELKNTIAYLDSILHKFKAEQNPSLESKNIWWDKFKTEFCEAGPPGFQHFRNYFTLVLNGVGIAMNTMAVIGSNNKIFPKEVAKFIDEKSEWFTKYLIPFGFAWNAVEAFVGQRPVECLSRLIPAVSFWALPFYNFNLATGVSSGINHMLELVQNRNGGKQLGNNMIENTKLVLKNFYDIFKDMFLLKKAPEKFTEQLGALCLLGGSIGGILFAKKDRDSGAARFFGNMRNAGGMVVDVDLICNKDPHPTRARDKKIVGLTCITASILNILMRWVSPELARSLNHISIAADDFGLTYWAQSSKRENDLQQKVKSHYQKDLHQHQQAKAKPKAVAA